MSDKSRAEFEEWMRSEGVKYVLADCLKVNDEYVFPETKLLFMCWQASRKAVVVELPRVPPHNKSDCNTLRAFACGYAAAGCQAMVNVAKAGLPLDDNMQELTADEFNYLALIELSKDGIGYK